jgi:hypothetical protein
MGRKKYYSSKGGSMELQRTDALTFCKCIDNKAIDFIITGISDFSQFIGDDYFMYLRNIITEFERITKDSGFICMVQSDRKMKGFIESKSYFIMYSMKEFKLKFHKIYIKNKIDKINLYQLNYCNILIFTKNGIQKNKNKKFM